MNGMNPKLPVLELCTVCLRQRDLANTSDTAIVTAIVSSILAWASIARGNAKLLTKVVSLLLVIRIDQKLYV